MLCDWNAPPCDGTGYMTCACLCDHCQTDLDHILECDGCDKCLPANETPCDHKYVRAVSPGYEVCRLCTTGRKVEAAS